MGNEINWSQINIYKTGFFNYCHKYSNILTLRLKKKLIEKVLEYVNNM